LLGWLNRQDLPTWSERETDRETYRKIDRKKPNQGEIQRFGFINP
jgi:hypothetical protein